MKHTALQNIITSDMFRGTKSSPNQWETTIEGANFSSFLLAVVQREPGGASIPAADSQPTTPLVIAPHQRPLFNSHGKSFGNMPPGIKSHKENPPDSIPFHITSPTSHRKGQKARNQGYGVPNIGQEFLSLMPSPGFINELLVDQLPLKGDIVSSQAHEAPELPASSPLYGENGVMPVARSVVANPYNAVVPNISRAKNFQIQAAGVSRSTDTVGEFGIAIRSGLENLDDYRSAGTSLLPIDGTFQSRWMNSPTVSSTVPKPTAPELFSLQEHTTETNQMGFGLPGPITGARQAKSLVLTAQPDTVSHSDIRQSIAGPLPENASSPGLKQSRIAHPVAGAFPQIHNITENPTMTPADQHLSLATERQQNWNSRRTPPVVLRNNIPPAPSNNPQNKQIGISSLHRAAPDDQIAEGTGNVTVMQQSRDILSINPSSQAINTPDEVITVKDVAALSSMVDGGISLSVEVRTNIPESAPVVMEDAGVTSNREIPIQPDPIQPVPDAPAFQQGEIATGESVRASWEKSPQPPFQGGETDFARGPGLRHYAPESAPVVMEDAGVTSNRDIPIQPDPIQVSINAPESAPVAIADAGVTSGREIPIQPDPIQPVPDAPAFQRSEIATGESVRASVEVPQVSINVPESAPVAIADAGVTPGREIPIQLDPIQPVPDAPVFQQSEIATGESVRVSSEKSPQPPFQGGETGFARGPGLGHYAPESAPVVMEDAGVTLGREIPIQPDLIQPVPDAPAFQQSEIATGESVMASVEVPEVKANTLDPASVVIEGKQDYQPSSVAHDSSDRGLHIQHDPGAMSNIAESAVEETVDRIGNVSDTPGTPLEQSILANHEPSAPYAWGLKARPENERRGTKGVSGATGRKTGAPMAAILGEQVRYEVHRYLESRGVPLGDAANQIGEHESIDGQKTIMLGQRKEVQAGASNESIRFSQNDSEMEIPRWDMGAVGRSAWFEVPNLGANETVDMTSSLHELPDRISMYVDNLANDNGSSSIVIQLEPKNLGKIRFRVSLKGDKITAKLSVDSLETKEMIELQLPGIKQSLTQHEVEVVELSVSVDDGSFGSNLRHSGFSDGRGDFSDNTGSDTRQTHEQEDEHRPNASTEQNITSDGQVDLLI